MKPTVTTEGKTAHLRYELPHRVHTSKVYPLKAPNGSTIVLYGHETGVGVLWRGGRPLKKSAPPPKQAPKPPPKVNGTSSSAIVIIDSDDEDTPTKAVPQSQPKAEFEDEEEELDPDQPYPSVVQQLRLALNTAVLHIAVPDIPEISAIRPAESVPTIFRTKIVFTVACADCSVRIITLPLSPPTDATKELPPSTKARWGEEVVRIPTHAGHQSIPRGVSMTWTSRAQPHLEEETDDETMEVDGEDDTTGTPGRRSPRKQQSRSRSGGRAGSEGWDVLLASHSTEVGGLLKIWRFELTDTSVSASTPITAYRTLTLSAPATRVAFNTAQNPKRRHSQLLIADVSGVTRVYDPFAPSNRKRRVGSATDSGGYVALFRATFDRSQTNTSPTLASRKRVLDAAWVDDGRSILALLADGEWGIWDVERTGPNPPSDPSAFSVRGFLGTSDESRSNNASTSPKKQNKLVPMTPNTRRTREEHLFRGPSSSPSAPTRGAISVASLPSTTGDSPEESALIWFGSEIHRISNVAQFWTRVASTGSGASLSRPPISKIQGLRLLGESITSIDQFETTTKEARMAVPRDALVSTEHRLMIVTSATEPLGRDFNAAFAREQAETEETRRTDQALLASGELDLGGMDRLLEDMEGSGSGQHNLVLGNPRRVLFASSTS